MAYKLVNTEARRHKYYGAKILTTKDKKWIWLIAPVYPTMESAERALARNLKKMKWVNEVKIVKV